LRFKNGVVTVDNKQPRDKKGRFLKGCPGGPGRPKVKLTTNDWRELLQQAITTDDFAAVVRTLIVRAKEGDLKAIQELFDRTLGPPVAMDVLERLDALEERFRNESITTD